jgi:ABC-type glycerol-3-phosphate transport system substrate-binding protein
MVRIALSMTLLVAALASAANPPSGQAADASVTVAAVFLDTAAVKQSTGSDFNNAYTVIEVTVTPKGGKPLDVQPDDFLLRINSNSESSGPMAAAQVYGAGGGLVLHGEKDTIGVTPSNPGYSGVTVVPASKGASADAIKALQSKMLPAKSTSDPVTGLLFFPIAKKRARDLDLVYSSPLGKLHVAFR